MSEKGINTGQSSKVRFGYLGGGGGSSKVRFGVWGEIQKASIGSQEVELTIG